MASLNSILADPSISRNSKFRNLHQGQDCFILGSGHSILLHDLKKLSGRTVMTQNHFHAHADIRSINPLYHVVVPKYQPKEFDDDWKDWLRSMDDRLPHETQLFFGTGTQDLVKEFAGLVSRAHYFKSSFNAAFLQSAKIDLSKPIMEVPTVISLCISIALYMGFSKIYLIGFDLDQICRMDNRDKVRFYGNSPVTKNQAEKDAEATQAVSGGDWFQMWRLWIQLGLLKKYAEKNGQSIINLAPGGLLNVFERRNFDQVIH